VISSSLRRRGQSRAGETNDDVESRSLSRAVRAEKPDHFALTDLQFHVVNDLAATVRFA